jgi:hypothetical protein
LLFWAAAGILNLGVPLFSSTAEPNRYSTEYGGICLKKIAAFALMLFIIISGVSCGGAQNSQSTNDESADINSYAYDEELGVYSKVISCAIVEDTMTVTFSAFSENPVEVEVRMRVLFSNDNGIGPPSEIYSVHERSDYEISIEDSWFEQSALSKQSYFDVMLDFGTITHSFDFYDGKLINYYANDSYSGQVIKDFTAGE